MACKSKHGGIVLETDYLLHKLAIGADRVVLRNYGFGWKVTGKIKPHLTPEQAAAIMRQRRIDIDAKFPARAVYRDLLIDTAGALKNRAKLNTAVGLMPDDPDGVWSTFDDEGIRLDLDDLVKLCAAYRLAVAESKAAAGSAPTNLEAVAEPV